MGSGGGWSWREAEKIPASWTFAYQAIPLAHSLARAKNEVSWTGTIAYKSLILLVPDERIELPTNGLQNRRQEESWVHKPGFSKFLGTALAPAFELVPGEGIEPPTSGLQNHCSTAELTRP